MKTPFILAIESSCDDTSVAILEGKKVLSNIVYSQIIHQKYGGVFPEFAAREHQENLVFTLEKALEQSQKKIEQIDAIAFTQGPGLIGSLMVGAAFAKSLAMGLAIPLLGINHLQGHVLASCIEGEDTPNFPFLALLVSGGHTQILEVENPLKIKIIGQTQDDAAGECFDKIGKMLGLPYPAGIHIDRLAQTGNPQKFIFPKAKMTEIDFSFSGLKTAVLYFLQKQKTGFIEENLADLCASVQENIVQVLFEKTKKALASYKGIDLVVCGGVAANSGLRKKLGFLTPKNKVFFPKISYCTDNAAMIAVVAYYQLKAQKHTNLDAISYPRLSIENNFFGN